MVSQLSLLAICGARANPCIIVSPQVARAIPSTTLQITLSYVMTGYGLGACQLLRTPQRKSSLGMSAIPMKRVRLMRYHRIRVGTFNVNGKLPTQDLSTWFGSGPPSSRANHNEQEQSIPPPMEPSPLPLSDKGIGEASSLQGYCVVAHFFSLCRNGRTSFGSRGRHARRGIPGGRPFN